MPFDKLVEVLRPERDPNRNPLFQAMIVFQNAPVPPIDVPGWTLTSLSYKEVDREAVGLDLVLDVRETAEGLMASLEYDAELFDGATINRMIDHFVTLLDGVVADPERPISELPLLTAGETRQLLVEWNDTDLDYPDERSVQTLFEAQVNQTPDSIAVTYDDQHLTYQELSHRVNRLARSLVHHGVQAEVSVAVLSERDPDLLTCILAIFKAGGCYLPLDPLHPPQRRLQLLQQSRASIVVTGTGFADFLESGLKTIPSSKRPKLLLISDLLTQPQSQNHVLKGCDPANLAYVMYTSGSTGTPRGVMVEHNGMLNHLFAKIRDLHLSGQDVVAQNSSQSFDISMWQFLAVLLVGGRVDIVNDEVTRDPQLLLKQIERGAITILEIGPSLLAAMLEQVRLEDRPPKLLDLRWLFSGWGESLPRALAYRWINHYPATSIMDSYGATECSDDYTHYPITPDDLNASSTPVVGRPIANMRTYILNPGGHPTPVGVVGEIHAAGVGVGRGYLHDPERTAETFLPDSFALGQGARLYKMGDLGRYLPDGNIELLGRIDTQTKIRGHRIELAEVEAVMAQHPGVLESVVSVHEQGTGGRRLVAYVVPKSNHTDQVDELRSFLKEKLPEYMVPSAFLTLDALPLTPNGKVDRKALPEPDQTRLALDREYVAPRTPVEKILAEIWSDVLGVEKVGLNDNFFDLGGHSLLMAVLISQVREAFDLEIPISSLFEAPTVAGLAGIIEEFRWVIDSSQGRHGLIPGDREEGQL